MILTKDNIKLGALLGLLAPLIGLLVFKYVKLGPLTVKEALQYMYVEPGHRLMSAALSVSLMANAILFTLYINAHKDKTAKGIFITTAVYGVAILLIKAFG